MRRPSTWRTVGFRAARLWCAAMICVVVFVDRGWAEVYVGAMLGASVANNFSDVESGQGQSFSDLDMDPSVVFGAKAGYFFERARWFGLETEIFTAGGQFKSQTVGGTGPGCPCTLSMPDATLFSVTWALNAILQYPGEKVQPYFGVGVGFSFADLNIEGSDSDVAAPTLNGLAGLRIKLAKKLGLFVEYKYVRSSFEFDKAVSIGVGTTSLKGDYIANMVVLGGTFHF